MALDEHRREKYIATHIRKIQRNWQSQGGKESEREKNARNE